MTPRRMDDMTRKEFWEWMKTCPAKENADPSGWFLADDMGDECRVFFYFDEEHDDDAQLATNRSNVG